MSTLEDNWQEGWDRMEEDVRRERDIGEITKPCDAKGCENGHVACTHDQGCCKPGECPGWECPTCHGEGVL